MLFNDELDLDPIGLSPYGLLLPAALEVADAFPAAERPGNANERPRVKRNTLASGFSVLSFPVFEGDTLGTGIELDLGPPTAEANERLGWLDKVEFGINHRRLDACCTSTPSPTCMGDGSKDVYGVEDVFEACPFDDVGENPPDESKDDREIECPLLLALVFGADAYKTSFELSVASPMSQG
jgi:hypothetical protein